MTPRKPHLVSVGPTPQQESPAPDMSYEWRDRQRIAAKNWPAIHVAADNRRPLDFFRKALRTWRA